MKSALPMRRITDLKIHENLELKAGERRSLLDKLVAGVISGKVEGKGRDMYKLTDLLLEFTTTNISRAKLILDTAGILAGAERFDDGSSKGNVYVNCGIAAILICKGDKKTSREIYFSEQIKAMEEQIRNTGYFIDDKNLLTRIPLRKAIDNSLTKVLERAPDSFFGTKQ